MARDLGDVLHYFLDDVEPRTPRPDEDPCESGPLGRWLARLDDPLEVVEADLCLAGRPADALARDRRGRAVLVLRVPPGGDHQALTRGLAQRARLGEALASGAIAWSDAGRQLSPGLLLVASHFQPDTLDAVRSLEPGFVRLVVARRPSGAPSGADGEAAAGAS